MKQAFTLIELIFVIIVIGILSAVMIPNIENNSLKQAAQQIAADIRYTQHLAMIDDKYSSNSEWYKGRWQIVFGNNNQYANYQPSCTVFSDSFNPSTNSYSGDPKESEIAIDPSNNSHIMTGGYNNTAALDYTNSGFKGSKRFNLGEMYGISSVTLSNGCSYGRISFDYLGRPFTGDQSTMIGPYNASSQRLIVQDCNITLTHNNGDTIVITVAPETGYIKVNY